MWLSIVSVRAVLTGSGSRFGKEGLCFREKSGLRRSNNPNRGDHINHPGSH